VRANGTACAAGGSGQADLLLDGLAAQNTDFSSIVPWQFEIPTVIMSRANAWPVSAIVPPEPSGTGWVEVPVMTPVTR